MRHFYLLALLILTILALSLRFLYYPDNIYFGFDQARDAFTSQMIINGDLKVIGPPTGVEGLYHGVAYYYLFSPIYYLSQGDPALVSAFLRIINSLGVLLIFATATIIFNKRVGLIAAFLFAISFEQSQYSIYLNHPPLAALTVLTFYLGLSILLFKKKWWGLLVAATSLGLSIQFEFILTYLIPILILFFLKFKKNLPHFSLQDIAISISGFILTTATLIVSMIKLQTIDLVSILSQLLKTNNSTEKTLPLFQNIYLILSRFLNDNFLNYSQPFNPFLLIILIYFFVIYIKKENTRTRLFFLFVWTLAGTLPYITNKSLTPLYYYSVGSSLGLLIMIAFFIDTIMSKFKIAGLILLIPIISNITLVTLNNPKGSIPTINVQSGMLLSDQKKVVDYIYQKAGKKPFAVNALTMPLFVNTTWSYLFEWYGQQKYHYLPIWGEDNAINFPGHLLVESSRSKLPADRFTIIEPTRGIRRELVDKFLEKESFFTTIIEEKHFGDIIVQSRKMRDE